MEGKYTAAGRILGEHCDRANEKYSDPSGSTTDAMRWATKCMELLWPNGVPANKVWVAGAFGRVFDKLYRIGLADNTEAQEDAFSDLGGYAIRMYELWESEKKHKNSVAPTKISL